MGIKVCWGYQLSDKDLKEQIVGLKSREGMSFPLSVKDFKNENS